MCKICNNHLISLQEALYKIKLALMLPSINAIIADRDDPATDLSSMDGAAMRSIDGLNSRIVLGISYAGEPQSKFRVIPNSCVKVMTGACIPKGADTVVPIENLIHYNDNTVKPKIYPIAKSHIRHKGSQAKAGDILISSQVPHNSARVGLRAQVGLSIPSVINKVTIGIATTGDELVQNPKVYQIRDSNGPMLRYLAQTMGAKVYKLPTLPDDYEKIKLFFKNKKRYNIIITSGGVSVGEKDYLMTTLVSLGATILFHGINIKPGKPTIAALLDNQLILALPGNPISSYVSALLLLPTAIAQILGTTVQSQWKTGFIKSYVKNIYNRPFLQLCQIDNKILTPIHSEGSADLISLAKADVFALIPEQGLTIGSVEYIEII